MGETGAKKGSGFFSKSVKSQEQHSPATDPLLQLSGNNFALPRRRVVSESRTCHLQFKSTLTPDAQSGIKECDSLVNILVIILKMYFNKLNSYLV